MSEYLKCFKNMHVDNPEKIVWRAGKYYKILHETKDFIFPTNELLLESINNFKDITFIPHLFEIMIPVEKLKGARVPLGFIRLTEEEVIKEEERKNTNNEKKN